MFKRIFFLFFVFFISLLFPLKTYASSYATNSCYNFLKALNNKKSKINKSFEIRESVTWGLIAVKKNPKDPDAHECLGEAYLKAGHVNSGIKQLDYSMFLLHEQNKNTFKKKGHLLSKQFSHPLHLFIIILFAVMLLSMLIGGIKLFFKKGRLKVLKSINDFKKNILGIEFKLSFLIIMVSIATFSFFLLILSFMEIILDNNQIGFNFLKISFSGLVSVGTVSMAYVSYLGISKSSLRLSALDLQNQFKSIQSSYINFGSTIRDAKGYNILILDGYPGQKVWGVLLDPQKSEEIKNKGDFIITIADYGTNFNDIYNDIIGKKEKFIDYYKSNEKDISLLLEGIGDEELLKIIPDLYKKIINYNDLFKTYLKLLKKYNISPELNLNVEEEKLKIIIKELKKPSDVLYKLDTEIINAIAIVVKKLEIV